MHGKSFRERVLMYDVQQQVQNIIEKFEVINTGHYLIHRIFYTKFSFRKDTKRLFIFNYKNVQYSLSDTAQVISVNISIIDQK